VLQANGDAEVSMRAKAASNTFDGIAVLFFITIIGLLIHGPFLGGLGAYRDDVWQFIQGMQAADGNALRFILSDTSGSLLSERPFSYFAWTLARAGFSVSLSTLHWILFALLLFSALLLSRISEQIYREKWLAFGAGVVFLAYPLSPMQTIMGCCVHYLCASLLTLLATWCSLRALKCHDNRRSRLFVVGSALWVAGLLTHEGLAAIYPAFIGVYLLSGVEWRGRRWTYKGDRIAAIVWLTSLVITLASYGLWRSLMLPLYQDRHYVGLPSYELVTDPVALMKKLIVGADTVFFPWDQVSTQLLQFPAVPWSGVSAVLAFVLTWLIAFRLSIRADTYVRAVDQPRVVPFYGKALMTAIFVVIAAIAIAAVSSTNSIDLINGFGSRVNFAAVVGMALWVPAALLLVASLWNQASRMTAFVLLVCVLLIAWAHIVVRGESPIVQALESYLLNARLLASAVIGIGLFTVAVLARCRRRAPRPVALAPSARPGVRRGLVGAHCMSVILASVVFVGALFHSSVKRDWADAWREHESMLAALQTNAPKLQDDTFVFIDARTGEHIRRVVGGNELGIHLLALYDNWSVMGFLLTSVDIGRYFYRDGFEVPGATWFAPGVKGPFVTQATSPVPRIGYDRFVTFEFDGRTLRRVPKIEVETVEGDRLILRDNPDRVLASSGVARLTN
jgi:hypothetical protein